MYLCCSTGDEGGEEGNRRAVMDDDDHSDSDSSADEEDMDTDRPVILPDNEDKDLTEVVEVEPLGVGEENGDISDVDLADEDTEAMSEKQQVGRLLRTGLYRFKWSDNVHFS